MKMVGIILRNNNKKLTLNKEIVDIIIKYNAIPIGIVNDKFDEKIINICDGFILQGGNDINKNDLKIVKYLYDNNIPTLGICLGMQMMSIILKGKLKKINNEKHKSDKKYVHKIKIDEKSKLYEIISKEIILVNSRHLEHITNINKYVTSYSFDNIVESIEDKNKTFFIGLQWHPESIKDSNSKKIFDFFFNTI
ncbi:MAG: gamma-glutamyl-gamma-aminobutyrate hydrolase family protein [Bacilli bacterium]|nr:gamma-glutamyl-gamma-aminobutyrate hydrolase family protein [Bacilli bacterium]